ncbi:acyltransferase [Rhodanobacter sp. DHG33]|uniref:acyltransferase family protein n=1 Tax=Rhodanobacter sp. DHG33 TaxID=2775921 RepID=UPI00177B0380|nr:acyltransferase [Rhodanobacter sp. DHG33]MBD8898446.1 acyltransferase [Rhodanobacter sp. DHG33]
MPRLPGLDLLRAIAIVWVMLFHSWMIGGIGGPLQPVADYGWMGVDLFFVLSGYLIGQQLLEPLSRGEPLQFGAFYLRRAFRILPAFFAVLAVYLLFPGWREAPGLQPAWQFITFTVNLLIDYEHNQAFSHAWSLCVEEHFYLLFPLLAWWLARRSSRALVVAGGVLIVAVGMLLRADAVLQGKNWLESVYYPTWTRLDGLLDGVMLATIQAYRPRWWAGMQQRANALAIAGLLLAAAAIWLFRDKSGFAASVFGFPLLSLALALLVAAAADTRSWLGRWRVPGAGWIAGISYSLYLSHKLPMHAVHEALAHWPAIHGIAVFAAYAAAILATGALLHYAIERPFLRLRNRLGITGRRNTADAQLAVPALDG